MPPQTYALDRAATGTGLVMSGWIKFIKFLFMLFNPLAPELFFF